MSTKINGNQIDAATRAIITALTVTEQINLPALTQTAINGLGTPAYGTLVYNTTEDMAQIYLQDAAAGVPGWDDVGGGGAMAEGFLYVAWVAGSKGGPERRQHQSQALRTQTRGLAQWR